jgi:hypothetical protein
VSPEERENKSAYIRRAFVLLALLDSRAAAEGGPQIDAGLHPDFVRFMASW